jgi:hypothetical protein
MMNPSMYTNMMTAPMNPAALNAMMTPMNPQTYMNWMGTGMNPQTYGTWGQMLDPATMMRMVPTIPGLPMPVPAR